MKGRVLVVAGSDSGGGAGIQADIKTVTALGGYAATAVTALTAQDTTGVHGVHEVPAAFVAEQIRVVLEDIGADAAKTGMLHRVGIIEAAADALRLRAGAAPLVVDPVMFAKGGASLLDDSALTPLVETLLPLARVATPNRPEAERLAGMEIAGESDMRRAGERILALGPRAVLVKGGHVEGGEVVDVLVERGGASRRFAGPRLESRHTHGTGCTLASAIAASLAQGLDLAASVARARAYVRRAIASAPGFGKGHGPLDHAHPLAAPGDGGA